MSISRQSSVVFLMRVVTMETSFCSFFSFHLRASHRRKSIAAPERACVQPVPWKGMPSMATARRNARFSRLMSREEFFAW